MIICWDNLENLEYRKDKGYWIKRYKRVYGVWYYIESCKNCGEPFLGQKRKSKYCSIKCLTSSIELNLKKAENYRGVLNHFYGKHHSEESKKKISEIRKGKKLLGETRRKISKALKGTRLGDKNPAWQGGLLKSKYASYSTYAPKISFCESVRRDPEDENILNVKCAYCGKWYRPSVVAAKNRAISINKLIGEENRFYCSTECKKLCPIYKKVKYSAEETNTKQLSREVQPELRQMVFERDNWKCIKCGSDKNLTCHHKEGILWEPIKSADVDECITLCKKCHKEVHKIEGCRTIDMRCQDG